MSTALDSKRYRRRHADGRAVARGVEYDADVLDLLIALGWLREGEADDPKQVGRAITALMEDTAKKFRH
jgi:hypothetical protein